MENHDMVSFMAEAQSATEELQMFLEAGSSEDIKTRLDKYYMVMILRALHPDLAHIRNQLLTSHEVPSMESLTTRLLRVPMPLYTPLVLHFLKIKTMKLPTLLERESPEEMEHH
ncbi:hypothetical protein VIGAN_10142700 [Vigna angularis var. angularis]|uniref:Uncharacterized protein n=1 Tax=Vigna angularis var. angularis TaxID=157739 RepID=A0A0S3T430_PHAAN|nr:hypothetical protein VIGAN_10142700 [Vigna angularis var. angularis]